MAPVRETAGQVLGAAVRQLPPGDALAVFDMATKLAGLTYRGTGVFICLFIEDNVTFVAC